MEKHGRSSVVDRGEKLQGRRLLFVLAMAAGIGAAFLAAALILAGCSSGMTATIRADGGARVAIRAEVPGPMAAKFRALAQATSGEASNAPLFDLESIRKAAAERPWMRLISLSRPGPDSIAAEIDVPSLEALAASEELSETGFIKASRGPGWSELAIELDRDCAASAAKLFPGIDPYLLEALSPPALEEDPVTADEYRMMLRSVLGEKAMPAMEGAAVSLSLTAPGAVLESEGGSLEGRVLVARIPIIDALVLERPIEIRLRWAR